MTDSQNNPHRKIVYELNCGCSLLPGNIAINQKLQLEQTFFIMLFLNCMFLYIFISQWTLLSQKINEKVNLTPLKVKCSAIKCILNFKSINCTWQRSRAPLHSCIILWQIHKTIHLQFMSWIVGCLRLTRNVATNQNLELDNPFYRSVLNQKFLYIFTLQWTLLLQKI